MVALCHILIDRGQSVTYPLISVVENTAKMNRIWSILMLVSLAALTVLKPAEVLPGMISAVNDALKLSLSLMALYTIWLGIINILARTGLNSKLARLLRPVIRLLFGDIPDDAAEYISLNMSANLLGMGNAATPMGVKAMNALDDKSGKATDAMIMLMVINATSIQLLPSTVISLRAAAGSLSAGDILIPTLITSVISATIAVLLAKMCAAVGRASVRRKSTQLPLPPLTAGEKSI